LPPNVNPCCQKTLGEPRENQANPHCDLPLGCNAPTTTTPAASNRTRTKPSPPLGWDADDDDASPAEGTARVQSPAYCWVTDDDDHGANPAQGRTHASGRTRTTTGAQWRGRNCRTMTPTPPLGYGGQRRQPEPSGGVKNHARAKSSPRWVGIPTTTSRRLRQPNGWARR
jgi:hypothetical protein